jgi:hypothetical protein
MNGKKAKLERKAIRAAGGEDKVSRRRRIAREEAAQREKVLSDRAAALAAETPEQRRLRKEEDARPGRAIAAMLASIGMLACGLPSISAIQRQPRYQRRGR